MKKFCLVFAFILLLTPVLASAHDLYPADFRGGDLSIYAVWDEFANISGDLIFADTFVSNPAGITPAYIDLTTPSFGVAAVYDGKILFDTSGIEYPALIIKSLNFDNENPLKRIRLQLSYDFNRTLEAINVIGGDSSTVNFITKNEQISPTVFYSAIDINIYPNPNFEQLELIFGGGCNLTIDQIVLDTQCVPAPAPIPASMLLLGSGILGLVGVGVRRKSA